MASPAWLLLIFAYSAKALITTGNDFELLENLHHEMDDYVSGLQALELNARKTLDQIYQQEETHILTKHKQNTIELLRLANKKKCQMPTLLSINQQSTSWADRFQNCMNLTQQLVYYENITVNIYDEYLEMRPIFCDAFNDVSLCLRGNDTAIVKLACTYDGIQGSVQKLESMKSQVIDTVNYLQNLVTTSIDDFKECFDINEKTFLASQQELIDMSC